MKFFFLRIKCFIDLLLNKFGEFKTKIKEKKVEFSLSSIFLIKTCEFLQIILNSKFNHVSKIQFGKFKYKYSQMFQFIIIKLQMMPSKKMKIRPPNQQFSLRMLTRHHWNHKKHHQNPRKTETKRKTSKKIWNQISKILRHDLFSKIRS